MKEITVEGKTVEEAVEEGLAQLSAVREQVDVEVLEEARGGLFGLGGKQAKVRLRLVADALEQSLQIVRDILKHMGIEAEVSGARNNGEIEIEIDGAGGVLIGRRGQTLSSMQYLVNRIINQDKDDWEKISIDVEGYRKRRESEMTDLAERLCRKVLDTKRSITVKNLSAQDRRIIHMRLKERSGVETYSQGEGHLRKLIVAPEGRGRRPKADGPSGGGTNRRVRTFTMRFESSDDNTDASKDD